MKTRIFLIICLITGIAVHLSANEKIYINREVTTHIVMPENIKMVDISTTKIIGNQCTDNIVRIKPYMENDSISSSEGYSENELLGTLTIIGERHIAQYDILYTESPEYASTITMYPTMRHSPISIRRFPCLWPRLHDMPGLSMEAGESSTRLYPIKTESGHTSTISIPSVTISFWTIR